MNIQKYQSKNWHVDMIVPRDGMNIQSNFFQNEMSGNLFLLRLPLMCASPKKNDWISYFAWNRTTTMPKTDDEGKDVDDDDIEWRKNQIKIVPFKINGISIMYSITWHAYTFQT